MSKNKAFEHAMFLQALGENDRADVEFIKAVEQEANDPSVIHSYAIFCIRPEWIAKKPRNTTKRHCD